MNTGWIFFEDQFQEVTILEKHQFWLHVKLDSGRVVSIRNKTQSEKLVSIENELSMSRMSNFLMGK